MIKQNNHYVSSNFHDFSHFEQKKLILIIGGKKKSVFAMKSLEIKKIEGNSTHVYLK